ncbi:MAG: hypothetical protein AABZ47_10125 [Planctomycetota bacterium]
MILQCPTYTEEQTFTCNDPDEFGQLNLNACDKGCWPCKDDTGDLIGYKSQIDGSRWMQPHPTLPSRDARGKYHDLKSNEPHRVPPVMFYRRGVCYNARAPQSGAGKECFNTDVCCCHPGASDVLSMATQRCPGGESTGQLLIGNSPDCVHYTGYLWPGTSDFMWCRTVFDHHEPIVELAGGGLFQSRFARTETCVDNLLIPCAASVPSSQCENSLRNEIPPIYSPGTYHYDQQGFQRWNFVNLDNRQYKMAGGNDLSRLPAERAELHIKNEALRYIGARQRAGTFPRPSGSLMDFRQLDFEGYSPASSLTNNSKLDLWSRSWESNAGNPGSPVACENLPVIFRLPSCTLRQLGCPVSVDIVLKRVRVSMSLVLQRICPDPTGRQSPSTNVQMFPSARFLVEAECGIRATLAGPCTVNRTWLDPPDTLSVAIQNDPFCEGFPGVVPNVDTIVYRHPGFSDGDNQVPAGTVFTPPIRVQWRGYLGRFSTPAAQDLYPFTSAPFGRPKCNDQNGINVQCQLGRQLCSNIVIPGWPYSSDTAPSTPNNVYGGSVGMHFEG